MELCSHLLSEINLCDCNCEEATKTQPCSPLLLPLESPLDLLASMGLFLLEEEEEAPKATLSKKRSRHIRKVYRRMRKASRNTQEDSLPTEIF